MKFFIAAVTVFLFGYTFACRPILRMYESTCCGDDYVEVAREFIGFTDEANLTAKGIKNEYLSTCPEGVWMGYEHENFTGNTYFLTGRSNATSGYDALYSCNYENTGRRIRSVKVLGSPADYTAKAIVTYPEMYQEGVDTTYLNDTRSIVNGFDSIVIVGSEEVEFFAGTYYSGLSVCIRPNLGYINYWSDYEEKNDDLNGTSMFTSISSFTTVFGINQFHSLRFGCGSKTNTLIDVIRYTH
ncbi:hypothetical protein Ocin01_11392 [Orchesella cincta]|uniref:Beta/gamma crystallin 'Greek key' domain-containing protein n=1 Tax=Orchesella cincta TaxID=48709 RepID=A0A1D2MQY0_ORCCI|nr:hypothetical protein Ocin01_11392 [Orchesella cincta]